MYSSLTWISLVCSGQVTLYCMFVAIMAFHARISDPRVGGTYLTLLNTLTNLGGNWCQTLALWLVDGLTWSNCSGASIPGLHCSGKIHAKVTCIIHSTSPKSRQASYNLTNITGS